MNRSILEFEQPIADLESKISELQALGDATDINIAEEIEQLRQKSEALTRSVYADLSAWQVAQIARHPQRPHVQDYLERIFTDFDELHGDRVFGDDPAIVGGLARMGEQSVIVIGHEKGRTVQEKVKRNFGMPKPEGYRKAVRLMKLAERFKIPVITFIDTPGAYPGIDAEARGQSEAIAHSIQVMTDLKVPVISIVIGEGGSGGALAIGVCDCLLMLQYSTYSVISPEGCASILWKTASKAEEAAEAMGIRAERLFELGLVDRVLPEPLGGAHRDWVLTAETVRCALVDNLENLKGLDESSLLWRRYERLMLVETRFK